VIYILPHIHKLEHKLRRKQRRQPNDKDNNNTGSSTSTKRTDDMDSTMMPDSNTSSSATPGDITTMSNGAPSTSQMNANVNNGIDFSNAMGMSPKYLSGRFTSKAGIQANAGANGAPSRSAINGTNGNMGGLPSDLVSCDSILHGNMANLNNNSSNNNNMANMNINGSANMMSMLSQPQPQQSQQQNSFAMGASSSSALPAAFTTTPSGRSGARAGAGASAQNGGHQPLTFHDLDGILQAAEDVLEDDFYGVNTAGATSVAAATADDLTGSFGLLSAPPALQSNGRTSNNGNFGAFNAPSSMSGQAATSSSNDRSSNNNNSNSSNNLMFDPTPIGNSSNLNIVDELPLLNFNYNNTNDGAGINGQRISNGAQGGLFQNDCFGKDFLMDGCGRTQGNGQMSAIDLLFPTLFQRNNNSNNNNNGQMNNSNNHNNNNVDANLATSLHQSSGMPNKRQRVGEDNMMAFNTTNAFNGNANNVNVNNVNTMGAMGVNMGMGMNMHVNSADNLGMGMPQSHVSADAITSMPSPNTNCNNNSNNKRSLFESTQSTFIASSAATSPSAAMTMPNGGESKGDAGTDNKFRFRSYQSEMWLERLDELRTFRVTHTHCLVPHNWAKNLPLAQWVKRQRYQYKLKQEGKHSTMTNERQEILEGLGFVWDSHKAAWEERWHELRQFCRDNGHTNVPSTYPENPQLSVWVKCQRRQYKLYVKGMKTNLTAERKAQLDSLGFVWNPRNLQTCR